MLAPKYDDYRQLLALAHYSLRLSSYFVFEQCFAYLIKDHFIVKMNKEPIKAKDIYETGKQLANIFRSEHILIDTLTMDTFEERFSFLGEASIFSFDRETLDIRLSEKPSAVLDLFAQMAEAFVDTYLIVLLTIE